MNWSLCWLGTAAPPLNGNGQALASHPDEARKVSGRYGFGDSRYFVGSSESATARLCAPTIAPGAKMIATTPLATLAPSTFSVPCVSLFTGTPAPSRNPAESVYQSRSPLASRRSGNPNVRNGRRPTRAGAPTQVDS